MIVIWVNEKSIYLYKLSLDNTNINNVTVINYQKLFKQFSLCKKKCTTKISRCKIMLRTVISKSEHEQTYFLC